MDIIEPVIPKASNGHDYILVAINYFTKWVEAASSKNVTQAMVDQFLKQNIICHYGILVKLITNNGKNLNGKMIEQLCQQFKIEHWNLVPYRPQMNDTVEATNKNIKKILSFALFAYHTSVHTSIGATLYSLVYNMEVVLLAEVEILYEPVQNMNGPVPNMSN